MGPNSSRCVWSLLQGRVWVGLYRTEELPVRMRRGDHAWLNERRYEISKRRVHGCYRVDGRPLHIGPICRIGSLIKPGGRLQRSLALHRIRWRNVNRFREIGLQRDTFPKRGPLPRLRFRLLLRFYNQLRRQSRIWPSHRLVIRPGISSRTVLRIRPRAYLDHPRPVCLRFGQDLLGPRLRRLGFRRCR